MKDHLTEMQIEQIRQRLNRYCDENTLVSNSVIAKNVGYSASYVSQFRSNKYPTPSKEGEFAQLINNFLDSAESIPETNGQALKYVRTENTDRIMRTAKYVMAQRTIGIVIGAAGAGKTMGAMEYKSRYPATIFVELTRLTSSRSLLEAICREMRTPEDIYRDTMFKSIVSKLKGTNRLMIFDESQFFYTEGLEIIRRIQDFTGVGILLLGDGELERRLKGARGELRQLYSRVGMRTELKQLTPAEVKAILDINYPDAVQFYKVIHELSGGSGRVVQNLINLVRFSVTEQGHEISEDLIRSATSSLLT